MLDPNLISDCQARLRGRGDEFYDLRHRTIYDAILKLGSKPADAFPLLLSQALKDANRLDEVGGWEFLQGLLSTPSAANLPYFLDILVEKYRARRMVSVCTEIIGRVYNHVGDFDELEWAVRSDLSGLINDGQSQDEEVWRWGELNDFDFEHDPSAVIGLRDGKTTRFLCRGYSAWLIGPSGVGKSSILTQWAVHLAANISLWGIASVRALRVGIIQAENDKGDSAEFIQGISRSMKINPLENPELARAIEDNIIVITERQSVSEGFCTFLERMIVKYGLDVVFVDPFLSFAGINVSMQDQCSKFLRQHLNPVLSRTGAVLIAAHHTGKPKLDKSIRQPTALDYAYAGIGSSELVNWARAVMVLLPQGDNGNFELKLAKRGLRANATHPSGEQTTSIYLRHATDRIFWEQVDAPQEEDEESFDKASHPKGGKPSVTKEIAASNLYAFCAGCTPEGEGLNTIAKRLEGWLATQNKDISMRTCQRIVAALVENQKLSKGADGLYRKGNQS